ncbi:hypothetical protein CEXT_84961 [Caerostris extrusa]|uniref:Uncharacterized protein n=1 Tax=Caerostris extrusa TaxID=172846 RepID=A0AAV4XLZ3_CAEEX|nr:hypothetical protein CEXT_84961 [Caerostris extrusa]
MLSIQCQPVSHSRLSDYLGDTEGLKLLMVGYVVQNEDIFTIPKESNLVLTDARKGSLTNGFSVMGTPTVMT